MLAGSTTYVQGIWGSPNILLDKNVEYGLTNVGVICSRFVLHIQGDNSFANYFYYSVHKYIGVAFPETDIFTDYFYYLF